MCCIAVPLIRHICVLAGSRYWQSGSFEVSKANTEAADTAEPMNGSPRSAVRVTVLTELEGFAYIQVAIRDSAGVNGGNGLFCLLVLFSKSDAVNRAIQVNLWLWPAFKKF